jgi:ribosomal protein L44E
MKEHYTKRTVEVQTWCKVCGRNTQHRVDDGRKGPCLICMDRLEKESRLFRVPDEPEEEQLDFEF